MTEEIKCKNCAYTAKVFLRENRYYVWCPQCRQEELLKTYNMNFESTRKEELVI